MTPFSPADRRRKQGGSEHHCGDAVTALAQTAECSRCGSGCNHGDWRPEPPVGRVSAQNLSVKKPAVAAHSQTATAASACSRCGGGVTRYPVHATTPFGYVWDHACDHPCAAPVVCIE